jgi:hypothetical protein
MRITLLIILLFLTLRSLEAKVITFERGGISDSPGIVEKNTLHLELGTVTYERNFNNSKAFNYDFISPLFRFGLVEDRFELRLQSRGLTFNRQDVNVSNIAPGFKLRIFDERKYLPSLQLISSFNIPFELIEGLESNFYHFHKMIINKAITEKLNFLFNLTFSFDSFDFASGREFTAVSLPYVFDINYALTDKLTVLAEVFGSWSLSNELGSNLGLAYGVTYAIRDDLVFDITNYYGLNDVTTDFGLTTGVSYKF